MPSFTKRISKVAKNFVQAKSSDLPFGKDDAESALTQFPRLRRELDVFFERAAEKGSDFTKMLSPAERVERAIEGERLEDEIFDIQTEIAALGIKAMQGQNEAVNDIKLLRERMDDLKQQYIRVVGGNELPIYFGRNPDSLQ